MLLQCIHVPWRGGKNGGTKEELWWTGDTSLKTRADKVVCSSLELAYADSAPKQAARLHDRPGSEQRQDVLD